MTTVDFIFDFASPNAYFVSKVLPGIVERTGAKVNIIPCLLGGIFKETGNQAPFIAFGGVKGKVAYEQVEIGRFIKKHQLTAFKMNPAFPINTVKVMRGAVVAKRDGFLDQYIDVVLKAFWEDEKNMGDAEVIVAVLNNGGLDGSAILAATAESDVKQTLIDNTANAVARGAFGIPTFFVGEEMFFGKERLGQVEEAILEVK